MAWRMGLGLKGGRRNTVGGSEHQASLKEALRNRGGARALVTPVPSEAEDSVAEDSVEENKTGLRWLNLTAFSKFGARTDNRGGNSRRSSQTEGSIRAALQVRGGVHLPVKPNEPELAKSGADPAVLAKLQKVAEVLLLADVPNASSAWPLTSWLEEKEEDFVDQEVETTKPKSVVPSQCPVHKVTEETAEDGAYTVNEATAQKLSMGLQSVEAGEPDPFSMYTKPLTQRNLKPSQVTRVAPEATMIEKHNLKPLPSKVKDLSGFWGKNAVGFAGPKLGGDSHLSKGEAEAKLQRLITAGGTIDFDEVRRLRKLIAELA